MKNTRAFAGYILIITERVALSAEKVPDHWSLSSEFHSLGKPKNPTALKIWSMRVTSLCLTISLFKAKFKNGKGRGESFMY